MKKKILILGASGFIGRNLTEFFAAQNSYEVYGTYLNSAPFQCDGVKLIRCDLRQPDQIDAVLRGMDIVIQAAAVTSGAKDIQTRPHIHITDNALMNSLLFRSAFEQEIPHVIILSCSIMYQSSKVPLKESDFDPNQEMYPSYFGGGWNKVYFEKMSEFFSRLGKNRYTVIRHSNIYGPWDKYDLERSHVFGATVTKVMTSPENGTIVVWGSGEEERDFLHVEDLVSFIYKAIEMQRSNFEIYNVGSGIAVSIRDLVRKIVDLSGKKISIRFDVTKPSIKTSFSLNCDKAYKELGWKPEINLEEGIRRTLLWYKGQYASSISS